MKLALVSGCRTGLLVPGAPLAPKPLENLDVPSLCCVRTSPLVEEDPVSLGKFLLPPELDHVQVTPLRRRVYHDRPVELALRAPPRVPHAPLLAQRHLHRVKVSRFRLQLPPALLLQELEVLAGDSEAIHVTVVEVPYYLEPQFVWKLQPQALALFFATNAFASAQATEAHATPAAGLRHDAAGPPLGCVVGTLASHPVLHPLAPPQHERELKLQLQQPRSQGRWMQLHLDHSVGQTLQPG
mmetsp:Transcript_14376/g.40899  ORF Transcript_14376/g.40899 Transcript_14376/m.40899 type:complete len:241 (-) Transcript_14376:298-1020(-)